MSASAFSHLMFEFSEVFLGGVAAATPVYGGTELSSIPPAVVLSAAQLGIRSPFRTADWQLFSFILFFFQIVEYPAKVSECDSTTMFSDRNSESSQTSWSGVLVLPGCRMRQ